MAAERGHTDIVDFLFSKGADVSINDKKAVSVRDTTSKSNLDGINSGRLYS